MLVGVAVLACFWGALLNVKGSPRHKAFGRAYLILLAPVLASIIPISLYAAERFGPGRVFQLGYLALVTVTAGWTAWRAIRIRAAPERFRGPVFKTLALLMLASGAAILALGLSTGRVLTIGFSSLGLVYGSAMALELTHAPAPMWWKVWHLNGVSLLFAATHASFVGLVARSLMPSLAGEVMHVATQLGTIAFAFALRFWLVRRYAPVRPALSAPGLRADRR
jgi:hypothetical protein